MDFPLEEGNTRPATELYLVTRTRNATRTNLYKLRGTLSLFPLHPAPPTNVPFPLPRNYRNFPNQGLNFSDFGLEESFQSSDACCIYPSNIINFRLETFENMNSRNYRKKFSIYISNIIRVNFWFETCRTFKFENVKFRWKFWICECYEFFGVTCSRNKEINLFSLFWSVYLMWVNCNVLWVDLGFHFNILKILLLKTKRNFWF